MLKALKQYFFNGVIPLIGFAALVISSWSKLKDVSVPDRVFLVLIAFLILAFLFVVWHLINIEKKAGSSELLPTPPKPSRELLFVLDILVHKRTQPRASLKKLFDEEFKGKEKNTFEAVVSSLYLSKLVKYPLLSAGGVFEITEQGDVYFNDHKNKLRKK